MAPGSRWMPSGYSILVGETMASNLPTTAGVIQPTGAPLGQPSNLCASLARLHCEVQSRHFGRWASLAYSTYLGGKTGNTGDFISASPSITKAMPMSSDLPILRISRDQWGLSDGLRAEWAELRGSPRDQAESDRQRHCVVHLCGRRQGRCERPRCSLRTIQLDGTGTSISRGKSDRFSHDQSG